MRHFIDDAGDELVEDPHTVSQGSYSTLAIVFIPPGALLLETVSMLLGVLALMF